MKETLFVILLTFAMTLPAKVTLSQAVVNAWVLDPGLDSQKLEEKAADTARLTALRQKYFSVHFSGGYRYTSDNIQITAADFPFPLGPQIPAETVILSTPNNNIDLKVSLAQPLYTGGLLGNTVKAEAIRAASERDLTRLKRIELAGKVKTSFFNHMLYSRRRDSLNFFLSSLDLHLKKVENLYAEELAKKSDLLETLAKVDEVRLNLQDLDQLIASEAVQFKSLCGYDPQDIDFQSEVGITAYEEAKERFLAGHPLLRSLDERARQLQIQKRSVVAAYLPQVSAFAEMHYGRPGQNFFMNNWVFYVQGGVNVSLPVFNWNKRGRDLELVDIVARKLENQRAAFIRESEKGLRQLYLLQESLGKKLSLLDGLATIAAEDVGLKEKLYEENQIDHVDLLAAMAGQERYLSSRGEILAQIEMLKANIDTLIGRCEEEK